MTGRATRGPGLYLVDSQRTERHQAIDPPFVWRELSIPERIGEWYFQRHWPAYALLVLGCALMGLAVVAMTWSIR